ncbi:universal stress protein [Actinoplanes sp. NPDC026670]|uniref:universal stress protein n=1 Tax=Actinoplanes sp. NPDC026670 TaxID=3154700 RepID=UPI0033C71790
MRNVVSVTERLPVVVGVNDLPTAVHSVDLAAAEAAYRAVPLILVHAWSGWARGTRYRVAVPDREHGRHLLELAVTRARHAFPGIRVCGELTDDSAATALLARSADASLLVLGHQDTGGHRFGWGSTAAYLARHSSCPVLVHQGQFRAQGPVTLAASGRMTATLHLAFDHAARAQCPLTVVHVSPPARPATSDPRTAAETLLAETVVQAQHRWPHVTVQQVLIPDTDIGYTVQRACRRSRLLVAGTGRKGWTVEAFCSAYADPGPQNRCPVLLVPPSWPSPAPPVTAVSTARC